MDGEDNGRVVVLAFIADKGDKAKTDELNSHLHSLFPTNNGREIAEPLKCSHSGKTVLLDGSGRTTHDGLCALGNVHESETLGAFLVGLVGVERMEVFWGVVRLAANEATEESGDDGL